MSLITTGYEWQVAELADAANVEAARFGEMGSNGYRRRTYCEGVRDALRFILGEYDDDDKQPPAELAAIVARYSDAIDGDDDPACGAPTGTNLPCGWPAGHSGPHQTAAATGLVAGWYVLTGDGSTTVAGPFDSDTEAVNVADGLAADDLSVAYVNAAEVTR